MEFPTNVAPLVFPHNKQKHPPLHITNNPTRLHPPPNPTQVPGATVHWYGKEDVRRARKVGHITICAPTPEEARRRLGLISPAALEAMKKEAFPVDAAPAGGVTGGVTGNARVAIIMGSDSDLPTMKGAAEALEEMGVEVDVTVVSAHRTPERMVEFARTAHTRGVQVCWWWCWVLLGIPTMLWVGGVYIYYNV